MPRVIGPSQSVPGGVDVETDDGQVVPLDPGTAAGLGLEMPQVPELGGQPLGGAGASAPMAGTGAEEALVVSPEQVGQLDPGQEQDLPSNQAAPAAAGGATPGFTRPGERDLSESFAQGVGGGAAEIAAPEQSQPEPQGPQAQPSAAPAGMEGFGVDPNAPAAPAAADDGSAVDPERLQVLQAVSTPQGGGGIPTRQETTQATDVQQTATRTMPNIQSEEEAQQLQQARATTAQEQEEFEEATKARIQAEAEAAQKKAKALQHLGETAREQEAKAIHLAERQEQELDEGQRSLQESIQKYQQMEDPDPDRIFSGAGGTFRRIIAAIGMGLGAAGSALTGAPNTAAQIISQAIDQDMEAQKTERRQQRGVIKAKQTLMDEMRAKHADERAAREAAKVAQYEVAKQKVRQFSQEAESDISAKKADEMIQQLDVEQARAAQQFLRRKLGDVTIKETRQLEEQTEQRRQTGGPGQSLADRVGADPLDIAEFITEDTSGIDPETQAQVNKLGKALKKNNIMFANHMVRDMKESVTDELTGEVEQPIGPLLAPLFNAVDKTVMRGLNPAEQQKFRQQGRNLITVWVKARSGAQVSDKERRFLEETFALKPDATAVEVANALRMMSMEIGDAEKSIRARFSDRVNAVYNQRRFNWTQRQAGGGLSSLQSGPAPEE